MMGGLEKAVSLGSVAMLEQISIGFSLKVINFGKIRALN